MAAVGFTGTAVALGYRNSVERAGLCRPGSAMDSSRDRFLHPEALHVSSLWRSLNTPALFNIWCCCSPASPTMTVAISDPITPRSGSKKAEKG